MLQLLNITNLRSIGGAELQPAPGINLVTGGNGSGKTTFLEAVYLLAMGRSFRHREVAPLTRDGESLLRLFTVFTERSGGLHRLGMERSSGQQWEVRLDGQQARRRSEILALLPIQWIGPDPQSLVVGTPDGRRAFLDAGLFHVEHGYLETLHNFNRALEQRNAMLRSGDSGASIWDTQLAEYGERLHGWRDSYVADLVDHSRAILEEWHQPFTLEFAYQRGWPAGKGLAEALKAAMPLDRTRRFTTVGPQRADLVIRSGAQRSGKKLSRGQLKMLATALHFAQSRLTNERRGDAGVLLFDDLPAELDLENRDRVIGEISSLFRQSFVAALTTGDLPLAGNVAEVFHVEHGAVRVQGT